MMLTSITSIKSDKTFQLIEEHMDVYHVNNVIKSEKVSSITECALMCTTTEDKECDGIVICEEAGKQQSFICKIINFLGAAIKLKSSHLCSFYEVSLRISKYSKEGNFEK